MLQGAIYDITNRKETEDALRKNEEKYRLLVENANDAILIVQEDQIKFFNPSDGLFAKLNRGYFPFSNQLGQPQAVIAIIFLESIHLFLLLWQPNESMVF